MRRLGLLGAAAGTAVALAATGAGSAAGAVIHVHHGHSIQRALNRAHPGDTITLERGTYFQSVAIVKPHITLRGAGSGRHGTVLRQPRRPGPCDDPSSDERSAICGGGIDPATGQPTPNPLHGVTIVGLRVTGWSGDGMVLFNTAGLTVRRSAAIDNAGYGITSFVGRRVRFLHNLSVRNHEAGYYIGDSPHADARLIGNRAFGNEPFGFLVRDSSHGVLLRNVARDNCVGAVFLDANLFPPPLPARSWVARRNRFIANDRGCPAGEDAGPTPVSGIGVAIVGASHVRLVANVVRRNRPSIAGALAGGIVVASGSAWGTGDADANLIARNRAHRNAPADIVWDGTGSGNVFRRNVCGTSMPPGLC